MRKIVYAGGTFFTGDVLAEALLAYASALARARTAATIFVPARTDDGKVGDFEVLIGPASQLVSEPADLDGPEIVDEDAAARLRALTAGLDPSRPRFEPPFHGDEPDWEEPGYSA